MTEIPETTDINLIVEGVTTLVDVARDRHTPPEHRIQAASILVSLAQQAAQQEREAQAANRETRRRK